MNKEADNKKWQQQIPALNLIMLEKNTHLTQWHNLFKFWQITWRWSIVRLFDPFTAIVDPKYI